MILPLLDERRHDAGCYTPRDVVEGVRVGCFSDLYAALAGNPPDHVSAL